jgi:hypothetical protein
MWESIDPKEGGKIPEHAFFKSGEIWLHFFTYLYLSGRKARDIFGPIDNNYEWRVPRSL